MTNLTNLTADELAALVTEATQLLQGLREQEREDSETRKDDIQASIAALDALLGPVDGDPGVDSIRAVRQHDEQTMGENAGLALSLAFEALEIVTTTTRDIAAVVARSSR